eukprot:m51a1_g8845 putative pas domain-containing protein tyrosine kinase (2300) ;mRNA; r:460668-469566
MEREAARGLQAAVEEAALLTRLPLRVLPLVHASEEEIVANVRQLVEVHCAFLIAGRLGNTTTQDLVVGMLRDQSQVPVVGPVSDSTSMRNVPTNSATFTRRGAPVASGTDELNAMLSLMARDWENLYSVALVVHATPFGNESLHYVNDTLSRLTNGTGVSVQTLGGTEPASFDEVRSAGERMFSDNSRNKPQSIILCTMSNTTARFVEWLARSGNTDLHVFALSLASVSNLNSTIGPETRRLLQTNRIQIYFTQSMPDPALSGSDMYGAPALLRKFRRAGLPRTHAALEGYLTGWFIYEVAQHAAARCGGMPTAGDFLYTVFADMRTFNVQDMTLGPFGDGGMSGGADMQSAGDACNQGVHEVYMTFFCVPNGTQRAMPGATVRFPGCMAPQWSKSGALTLVGAVIDPRSLVEDMIARKGLMGAMHQHNAESINTAVVKAVRSTNASYTASAMGSVAAVVCPRIDSQRSAEELAAAYAVISPMPGLYALRRPFVRGVVNLFPSAYDEMAAAFEFFSSDSQKNKKFAVIRNDRTAHTEECMTAFNKYKANHTSEARLVDNYEDKPAEELIAEYAKNGYRGFFILGGQFNANDATDIEGTRLLNSQVAVSFAGEPDNRVERRTYRLSVSPPAIWFASTSALRTEYATWVSSEGTEEKSFQSFFVGKFVSLVIDEAKGDKPNKTLGRDEVLRAVYKRGTFTIEGITVGQFSDTCGGSRDCCNQGLNTVYVVKGLVLPSVISTYGAGNCGRLFMDEESTPRQLALALGLVEFFNIRRGELELGLCLGQGRIGSIFRADWHGTTVAVRVIDKRATPKEDQRLIKEEVLLLHKHHHPNLLMLMGYCETPFDIFVVTEYMEGGTLADFLRKEKRYATAYSLVAMAFLDAKGAVKVSDFWYGSKKGAFSSGSGRSLKKAAWQPPEVIAGTFLTPATDVYAFGIVLWELIAPIEMTQSSSASGTASERTGSTTLSGAAAASGMLNMTLGGIVEMQGAQAGPPEIPPNATPEVADLMERCWQTQPERRPSIFQILRHWPTTFAGMGAFEMPQDLNPFSGEGDAAAVSQHSRNSTNSSSHKVVTGDDLADEMAASMASFMAVKTDSDALQTPHAEVGLTAVNHGNNTKGNVLVIGMSTAETLMERGNADGLDAALREASRLTALHLELRRYPHSSEGELVANVRRLVEEDCVFMIAGKLGNTTTEATVVGMLRDHGVPLVGAMSDSDTLRDVAGNTAVFALNSGESARLPMVVNVRASGTDELNAMLALISGDWENLASLAMVGQQTPFGRSAYAYLNDSLTFLTRRNGLLSHHLFRNERLAAEDLGEAEQSLFPRGKPSPTAVIVCTTPVATARFVKWLARTHGKVAVFAMSWCSASDLNATLDKETRALMKASNFTLFFTQSMLYPTPPPEKLPRSPALLRRFSEASVLHKSHAALEGYLTGWFIYEVAQQTATRAGLPLTRGDFLNIVFVDVRTFNVLDVTMGPYGDGGASGDSATQTAGDACNQGAHEVFMTKFEPLSGSQMPLAGASMRFSGCRAPKLSSQGSVTVVGSVIGLGSGQRDMAARIGLIGAMHEHNAGGMSTVTVRSSYGSPDHAAGDLSGDSVVAVAGMRVHDTAALQLLKDHILVSPMPGLWNLRRPFNRRVVNLFPSAYDEVQAAFEFVRSQGLSRVAVLSNDNSAYTRDCSQAVDHASTPGIRVVRHDGGNLSSYVRANGHRFQAFVVLGGQVDMSLVFGLEAHLWLFNSEAVLRAGDNERSNTSAEPERSEASLFRLSVSPPMVNFATTSALRTEYANWVSSADTGDTSFQGFFVGKFLALAIDKARGRNADKVVTATSLADAVYKGETFAIEGIRIGPFADSGSSSRRSCNQGLDTVYVVEMSPGFSDLRVAATFGQGDCGRLFMDPEESPSDGLPAKLGAGLGRRTVEFFNIRKGELELGLCFGQGRFGSVYMADWHGTTVAVRVIDKRATPKEDQRLIKEEVLLLHKHHHPNLLMLMGYCETRNELLVVTEFMEGGTLSDFLLREKRRSSEFSLVGMAFDVLKGIAYLHSCKPPIVHGSICTHNLLLDAKGTVKVSDFWFSTMRGALSSGSRMPTKKAAWQPPEVIAGTFLTPATDVYAFGIVLWELIAPVEANTSSSASGTPSESQSSGHTATAAEPGASGMLRQSAGGLVELCKTQLGPPEIPHNAPPEVADLLERCWISQPERRPSVFQILRSWPSTFSAVGEFETPQGVDFPVACDGPADEQSRGSGHSRSSGHSRAMTAGDLSDDMAASMVSFMPHRPDSAVVQGQQTPEAPGGLSGLSGLQSP